MPYYIVLPQATQTGWWQAPGAALPRERPNCSCRGGLPAEQRLQERSESFQSPYNAVQIIADAMGFDTRDCVGNFRARSYVWPPRWRTARPAGSCAQAYWEVSTAH